ncbi:hypothetical protein V9T40_007668 [Parthenolecanium corni]|uniref:Uncharacterized protein n=1 Tax=Parthenolecanium corni TaxID=536013 RepID=A0AAN9Y6C0_9HEMI
MAPRGPSFSGACGHSRRLFMCIRLANLSIFTILVTSSLSLEGIKRSHNKIQAVASYVRKTSKVVEATLLDFGYVALARENTDAADASRAANADKYVANNPVKL